MDEQRGMPERSYVSNRTGTRGREGEDTRERAAVWVHSRRLRLHILLEDLDQADWRGRTAPRARSPEEPSLDALRTRLSIVLAWEWAIPLRGSDRSASLESPLSLCMIPSRQCQSPSRLPHSFSLCRHIAADVCISTQPPEQPGTHGDTAERLVTV